MCSVKSCHCTKNKVLIKAKHKVGDITYTLLFNYVMCRSLSYRNQSIDLLCKSVEWFLYDSHFRQKVVKYVTLSIVFRFVIFHCEDFCAELLFKLPLLHVITFSLIFYFPDYAQERNGTCWRWLGHIRTLYHQTRSLQN